MEDVLDGDHLDGFVCSICLCSFSSKIGLGIHKKRAHPVDYNEEICLARAKPRWNDEEIKLLTLEEARAPPHVRAMNLYLLERHRSNRSLESIKCIRKKQSYRNLIIEFRNLRLSRRIDEIVGLQGSQVAATDRLLVSGSAAARKWLLAKKSDIIPEMNGGIWIRSYWST